MEYDSSERDDPVRAPVEGREVGYYTIIESIADAIDTDPTAMPPVSKSIDIEGVAALFSSASPDSNAKLTFEYEGVEVTVTADEISVRG